MNPLTNVLDFGPLPQGSGGGSPPPPIGGDYLGHEPFLLIGLTHQFIDFGWQPFGTSGGGGPPPIGTDYIGHEAFALIGLAHQFIDFGRQPFGTSGAAPITATTLDNPSFLSAMENFGRMGSFGAR